MHYLLDLFDRVRPDLWSVEPWAFSFHLKEERREKSSWKSVISSGVQWSPFVSICMRRLVQLSVETWRCNDRLSQHSEGGLHTPHTQINPCQSPHTTRWQPVIPRHVSFLLRAAKWHSWRSESAKLCLITLKSEWYLRRGALMAGRAGLRGILSWLLERALIYSLKLSIFSASDRQGNGKQLRPLANCLNVCTFAIFPCALCGSMQPDYLLHVRLDMLRILLLLYECFFVTLRWSKFSWREFRHRQDPSSIRLVF